ncbi:WXG100 family type VII secretion target [Demequina muriae]|uniref:ESAT-6-like protein n=1 Tax=Demequina muriae TaxID=3051664 RepID=A0ABT8GFA4_9MICO|nr:WXG100 family type VII secretion target [Demequina sp. EGI L300058]MDN4480116.1 WXG100 family type VII secretion target [Demequina sp. EGI L300058]
MTRYHVDAAEVAAASALASGSAESIRGEVAAMMGHLTALEGSWQGGAAAAFAGVLDQWRGAQVQVEQALDALTVALSQAAEQYQTAEDTAARLFTAR